MKKHIAIIAGGDSSEHEVSLRSAAGIYSFLDKERYEVHIVRLRGRQWEVEVGATPSQGGIPTPPTSAPVLVPIDKNDFSYTYQGEKRTFDYAYITIHGTPGENGRLQGYLDMMGIPYSCCGVLAAAMTFNKYTCNHYLQGFGIRIAPSLLLRKGEARPTDEEIVAEVGLPCFIKSNVGGSSFGCTKVKTLSEVAPAIERAFEEGDEVICEAFMQGTEITCGVYKTREKAVAFPITEVVTKNEFFDYDAKYKGQVDEITPACIPNEVRDAVQAMTLRIYDILGCHGIIRVDYILSNLKMTAGETPASPVEINLLEVNTTPGMTATSFIPQQVRAAGLNIGDVLSEIIEESNK
ncbi:MAG: D-alanine--D-alanine ligase [Paludibacteraceae bacterium]|nr:D-alanine--D-alanine ligase [Paludibacteraceae bacterium]